MSNLNDLQDQGVTLGNFFASSFTILSPHWQNLSSLLQSKMFKSPQSVLDKMQTRIWIREDTHKKSGIFSGRTTKVLPSIHQWLSGPCHFFSFFFSLIIAWNGFWHILFFPIFGLKKANIFLLANIVFEPVNPWSLD